MKINKPFYILLFLLIGIALLLEILKRIGVVFAGQNVMTMASLIAFGILLLWKSFN